MRQPQDKSLGLRLRGRRCSSLSSIAFRLLNAAPHQCAPIHRCRTPHVGHFDTWRSLELLLRSQMLESLQRDVSFDLATATYYHSCLSWHRLLPILMLFSKKMVKFFTNTVKKNLVSSSFTLYSFWNFYLIRISARWHSEYGSAISKKANMWADHIHMTKSFWITILLVFPFPQLLYLKFNYQDFIES